MANNITVDQFNTLSAKVDSMEKQITEINETIQKIIANKAIGGKTRSKGGIKGDATVPVVVEAASSTTPNTGGSKSGKRGSKATEVSKTDGKESTSDNKTVTAPKKENRRAWFVNKWADGLRVGILEKLKLTDNILTEKYKTNYSDKKHTDKDTVSQLRAEAGWVYKDYIQSNTENQSIMNTFRDKVDTGEYSDNVTEENSTE